MKKTLYLIRHAKSDWSDGSLHDFERGVKKRGYRDLKTMGSYLLLRGVVPDVILSSPALRAQITADKMAKKIDYDGAIHYMEDLYQSSSEKLLNTLLLQDNALKNIFLVGHNPELTQLANYLLKDNIMKIPTLGIIAISFPINSWEDIVEHHGKLDFFIHPKQFKYYVPKQIQATLKK